MTFTHSALTAAFFTGLMGLTFNRTYFLSALLCLESMMLTLLVALSLWALQLNSANFLAVPLFVLAFSACEASLGLALLVATTRTHGTNRLQNLNLLQC